MRKEEGRKGGVKCPDERRGGLFTCFPLGKEQCFEEEEAEQPLAQLSSAGLRACPSLLTWELLAPRCASNRSTLPGEEANRPNKSLPQAPPLGHSIPPSPSGPGRAGPSEGLPCFLS